MQVIKDENVNLLKRLKDDKSNLKNVSYQIDEQNKEQVEYFNTLTNIEFKAGCTKL